MAKILYAAIGNQPSASILVEVDLAKGRFSSLATALLRQVTVNNSMSYVHEDKFKFHTTDEDGVTCLCLCSAEFSHAVAYSFLRDIRERFHKRYGEQVRQLVSLSAKDFTRELEERLEFFSSPEADPISQVRSKLEETRQTMVQNLDTVLKRGESLEHLIEKTSLMMDKAEDMKRIGGRVKRHFWWKNLKLSLILFAVLLVIVFFVVWGLCGIPKFQDC